MQTVEGKIKAAEFIGSRTSLTSAAGISNARFLRHQLCDTKSFAHASLGKFKLRGGYAVRRADRGKREKTTKRQQQTFLFYGKVAKMTSTSQGITLKGSAELVADFFCTYVCGRLRCWCRARWYVGGLKKMARQKKNHFPVHYSRDYNRTPQQNGRSVPYSWFRVAPGRIKATIYRIFGSDNF